MTSVSRYGSALRIIWWRLLSNSEFTHRNCRRRLAVCEWHCRQSVVAGSLWRQQALKDRDLVDHELGPRGGERRESRGDRLRLGTARIVMNAREREVGRERAVVELQPTAPEAGGDFRAQLEDGRPALGYPDPDDARAAALWESAGPLECQMEIGDVGGSLAGGARHLVEPLVRGPAEKGERDVKVGRFHTPESRKGRWEDL